MQTTQNPSGEPAVAMPVMVAAELQDALLVTLRDLQRLEGLLDHATQNLLQRFDEANGQLSHSSKSVDGALEGAREALRRAVTELQFHDMSSQLIAHMSSTLQACALRLGAATMGIDEEEDGPACLPQLPDKPNPVTQSEMDAGSVELF
ncbi:hypothetical protein [Comamonas fluminis]|uniref:hypothetical protein n=1 Tax=Comamonas fluminis TaxID=2796366 RepID=UPI001C44E35E|nr:hypothetical protein [Comamonas fluminis]